MTLPLWPDPKDKNKPPSELELLYEAATTRKKKQDAALEKIDNICKELEAMGKKLDMNFCHDERGQFCEEGGEGGIASAGEGFKLESVREVKEKGAAYRTYSTPYENVNKVVVGTVRNVYGKHDDELRPGNPLFDENVEHISSSLKEMGIDVNELRFVYSGLTTGAAFNGMESILKVNTVTFDEDYHEELMKSAIDYRDGHGGEYWCTASRLELEKGADGRIVNYDHEEGHALMWKENKDVPKEKVIELRDNLRSIRAKMAEIQESKGSRYWATHPEEKQIKAELTKAKTAFVRESNKLYTTKEFSKIANEEVKAGWTPPSKYAKADKPELFAECYACYKNGGKDYLTPKIVGYIDGLRSKHATA